MIIMFQFSQTKSDCRIKIFQNEHHKLKCTKRSRSLGFFDVNICIFKPHYGFGSFRRNHLPEIFASILSGIGKHSHELREAHPAPAISYGIGRKSIYGHQKISIGKPQ